MFLKRIIILVACFWVVLVASTAVAGPMHDHGLKTVASNGAPVNLHVHKAASPFEVKGGGKRLHCELLGHSPLLPCPHHKIPMGEKDRFHLSKECDGGPFPVPSSRSMGDSPRFLVPMATPDNGLPFSGGALSIAVFYDSFLSFTAERPPRAL